MTYEMLPRLILPQPLHWMKEEGTGDLVAYLNSIPTGRYRIKVDQIDTTWKRIFCRPTVTTETVYWLFFAGCVIAQTETIEEAQAAAMAHQERL